VTAHPAQFAVRSVADPGPARRSLLTAHRHLTQRIGAAYMENAALCPARVHRGQTVGRGAVRLHHEVAVGDVHTTARAGHGAAPLPLLEEITTGAEWAGVEWAEEAGIAARRPDVVGTVVDMGGDLSLHHRVGDRGPSLLLHPDPEMPGWTPARGVGALQVPKELTLVCARGPLLLKDRHRLPDLTRAVEVWLWMSPIDKPCSLSFSCI
jgi:hypothetical protein